MLTVSVFGSCRVVNPFNHLRAGGSLVNGSGRGLWFTHSMPEAIQKYRLMRGEIDVPDDVAELISAGSARYNPALRKPDLYEGSDVFIVEVPSLKLVEFNGYYLQQWALRAALRDAATPPDVMAVAERATQHVQTQDELKASMQVVLDTLGGPVLFVPHIKAIRDDGTPIPDRELIREAVTEFCADGRATMYDPSPLVHEYGYDAAMRDASHFNRAFEFKVADQLLDAINATQQAPRTPRIRASAA